MDQALVVADPVFAAGMSAASNGIGSMSSAICSITGMFFAGFAASEVKSRLCAKRRACQLEAVVAHIGGEVSKLQRKVRGQALRLATLKDVKKKAKKLQKKVGRQMAVQKKMRIFRRQATHPGTCWENVVLPTHAEAKMAEAFRQALQSTAGEGAVGIHCASTAGSSCAETHVAGVACHPSEDKPNARDIEKAKKLRAEHPSRIPVFCTPSTPSAASSSSPCLQLKLLVPEHVWGRFQGRPDSEALARQVYPCGSPVADIGNRQFPSAGRCAAVPVV